MAESVFNYDYKKARGLKACGLFFYIVRFFKVNPDFFLRFFRLFPLVYGIEWERCRICF